MVMANQKPQDNDSLSQVLNHCEERHFTGLLLVEVSEGFGEIRMLSGILESAKLGGDKSDLAMDKLKSSQLLSVEATAVLPSFNARSTRGLLPEGALGSVRPVELMQFCEKNSLTCELHVRRSGSSLLISYDRGEIKILEPESAMTPSLLEATDGDYRIVLPQLDALSSFLQVAKPQVAKPQVAKPQVAKPQVAKPQVAKPRPVAKSQVAKSQVAKPQPAAKPQPVARPQVAKVAPVPTAQVAPLRAVAAQSPEVPSVQATRSTAESGQGEVRTPDPRRIAPAAFSLTPSSPAVTTSAAPRKPSQKPTPHAPSPSSAGTAVASAPKPAVPLEAKPPQASHRPVLESPSLADAPQMPAPKASRTAPARPVPIAGSEEKSAANPASPPVTTPLDSGAAEQAVSPKPVFNPAGAAQASTSSAGVQQADPSSHRGGRERTRIVRWALFATLTLLAIAVVAYRRFG